MSNEDDEPKDWNEAYRLGFNPFEAGNHAWAQPDPEPQRDADVVTAADMLVPIDLNDFLNQKLPARAPIMKGLLFEKSTNMIYAWRGTGKTWFNLWLAYALATGTPFLKWQPEKPRRVIYIDGEMPAADLHARLQAIIDANGGKKPAPGYFKLLPADLYELGVPNLAKREGQAAVEAVIGDAEVVFFDNVSTLFFYGKENDRESWAPVQTWLLRLRRQGKVEVIIHHTGKGKDQRGTSSREDILDVSIKLEHPPDYEPTEGARFLVKFEKARGLTGVEPEPFEARLQADAQGKLGWTMRAIEDAHLADILELKADGKSVRKIAEELGLSKSAVHRALNKGKA
jgi:hypothetical protein